MDERLDATVPGGQMHFFVGRMDIVIRQAKAGIRLIQFPADLCISLTTGMEPPSRRKYGRIPHTVSKALSIARTPMLFRSDMEAGLPAIRIQFPADILGACSSR